MIYACGAIYRSRIQFRFISGNLSPNHNATNEIISSLYCVGAQKANFHNGKSRRVTFNCLAQIFYSVKVYNQFGLRFGYPGIMQLLNTSSTQCTNKRNSRCILEKSFFAFNFETKISFIPKKTFQYTTFLSLVYGTDG